LNRPLIAVKKVKARPAQEALLEDRILVRPSKTNILCKQHLLIEVAAAGDHCALMLYMVLITDNHTDVPTSL
jgi:hypothetical protein